LLQRRADDQAATAGDDGGAARRGALLERDGAGSRGARLDAGRNPRAARADDGDIGLKLPGIGHRVKGSFAAM
jgi:hypothetical protein